MRLRDLPSVDELVRGTHDPLAVAAARDVLERAREEIRAGAEPGDLPARLAEALAAARRHALRRVLNATGVIVHTNLGRAPLARAALDRIADVGGFSNLEYDLSSGSRGSRQDHLAPLLRRLTGAESAIVVNNNAAALLLALAALAEGREVVVSRGELIEIGDGFRIRTCSPARARGWSRSGRRTGRGPPTTSGRSGPTQVSCSASTSRTSASSASPSSRGSTSSRPSRAATTCPFSTTSARARSSTSRASRRRRHHSPRAPISSASPATSCSGARRRGSSSAAPTWSSSCAGILSTAPCARTS